MIMWSKWLGRRRTWRFGKFGMTKGAFNAPKIMLFKNFKCCGSVHAGWLLCHFKYFNITNIGQINVIGRGEQDWSKEDLCWFPTLSIKFNSFFKKQVQTWFPSAQLGQGLNFFEKHPATTLWKMADSHDYVVAKVADVPVNSCVPESKRWFITASFFEALFCITSGAIYNITLY